MHTPTSSSSGQDLNLDLNFDVSRVFVQSVLVMVVALSLVSVISRVEAQWSQPTPVPEVQL
ncbi:MAG: hypothetical protein NW237_03960 [Cyanobacteriota bacterium]|nr:hypothetical protein [Cyanobacteriota bacterium]